jgi:hypothetical protein
MIEVDKLDVWTTEPAIVKAMDRLNVLRALFASKGDRGAGVGKLRQHAESLGVSAEAINHALADKNNIGLRKSG